MCLRSLQRLLQDSSGRFAPFMFGLLLAVSAFSMTMKTRVESKLNEQKLEADARAKNTAEDLSQAMEVSMLLESGGYDSSFTGTRARNYLSGSTGLTTGGAYATFDQQTGTTTLDGLARQSALVGVTDDTLINTAITAGNAPTTFNSTGALPTAVVDSLAIRQTQLGYSKQRLDAFSADVLDFGRSKYTMPDTTELAAITSATGATTFWGGAFTNTQTNIFSQTNQFATPWSGANIFSNTVTLPYTSTGVTYSWFGGSVTNAANWMATVTRAVVSDGIVAIDSPFGVGTGVTSYIYIYELQSGAWVDRQRLVRTGPANYGLAIADNILAVSSVDANAVDLYQRRAGNWYKFQTITDPTANWNNLFGSQIVLKSYNDKVYLYIADASSGNDAHVQYYLSSSASTPNFVLQTEFDVAAVGDTACVTAMSISADIMPAIYSSSSVAPQPILAVGCRTHSSSAGRVRLYRGTTAAPFQTLSPSTLAASDQFGYSVDLKWPYLAVGAYYDETTVTDQGAVYVFQDTGNFTPTPNFTKMAVFQSPLASAPAGCASIGYGAGVGFVDQRTLGVYASCTTVGLAPAWYTYTLGNTGWALSNTNTSTAVAPYLSSAGGVFAWGASTAASADAFIYRATGY